jgi:hypothetical protein
MKRIVIALVLLASLVFVGGVQADGTQAPGTWVSSINIQNVGTGPATVQIEFYDATGASVLSFTVTPDIPAGGSRSLYVPADVTGLPDGQFSAVVSSPEPIQVVANQSSTAPSTAGAYNGIDSTEAATTLYFPGAYNNYFGFYSELAIQNTTADTANVTLSFYNDAGSLAASPTDTIPGNATKVFVLEDLGIAQGRYSVEVVSTNGKNLVGVCNNWTSAKYGEFSDYNAYSGGTTIAYAPSLVNNYYGFVSSLTVQNIDTTDADILVTYSNGETETVTLAPRTSKEYYQPNNPNLPSGNVDGIFSAKIESTNGKKIVVLVNQEDKTKGSLASYNAPSEASTSINCPVTMKAFYQWFSAVTVQNVGSVATDITITFATGHSRTAYGVPANGTHNFIQLASAGSPLPDNSSVSAVVTAAQPIVAIVNENSDDRYLTTPGDYLCAYTAIAQ